MLKPHRVTSSDLEHARQISQRLAEVITEPASSPEGEDTQFVDFGAAAMPASERDHSSVGENTAAVFPAEEEVDAVDLQTQELDTEGGHHEDREALEALEVPETTSIPEEPVGALNIEEATTADDPGFESLHIADSGEDSSPAIDLTDLVRLSEPPAAVEAPVAEVGGEVEVGVGGEVDVEPIATPVS